jgi:hypothetical protein
LNLLNRSTQQTRPVENFVNRQNLREYINP